MSNRKDEPTDEEIYEITGRRSASDYDRRSPAEMGRWAADQGPTRNRYSTNRRDEPTDEEIYEITGVKVAGTASITWAKLKDGSWGIRSTSALRVGSSVVVARKDGTKSNVTVGKEVWSGSGVWLYSLKKAGTSQTHKNPDRQLECPECGDYVYPGTRCWEVGAIHDESWCEPRRYGR